jgi:DNA polymerase III subunit beta
MLFMKADRDAILKPLQKVAGIVERRHTLPILANVLLRKQGPEVSFLASDVEIQVQTTAELGSGEVDSATTVSARKLIDILRALPEGIEVSMRLDDKRATLQAGKSRFALQTLGADDFPIVALSQQFNASFELPQRQLRHLFQMVHFAMAVQDVRYYLNGLLLVTDGDQVRVVATDGHRLAYCHARLEGAALAHHEVIIPRKTVLELQRQLEDSDEPVRIDLSTNQARLRFGQVEMISKLVEGRFPDYQRVIPNGYTKAMVCPRERLASSLSRASILTSDKFKGVRLNLADGLMRIQTSNADQEEAIEEIEVDYQHEAIEIGFNVGYLQDVLGNLKTADIRIEFGDSTTSALITVPGDGDFKYVVMPMRI